MGVIKEDTRSIDYSSYIYISRETLEVYGLGSRLWDPNSAAASHRNNLPSRGSSFGVYPESPISFY